MSSINISYRHAELVSASHYYLKYRYFFNATLKLVLGDKTILLYCCEWIILDYKKSPSKKVRYLRMSYEFESLCIFNQFFTRIRIKKFSTKVEGFLKASSGFEPLHIFN